MATGATAPFAARCATPSPSTANGRHARRPASRSSSSSGIPRAAARMAWESADPLVRYRTFEELGTDLPHPMSDHVPMDMFACECDCGGVKVRLVLPESEDLVVDVYSALGKPNDDPHWADLWHGSVALAAAIFANPDVVRGKRVVDLGCGLGLGGIAAAMCGAKEVVMTDREERALWCSLAGCALNGVADVTPLTGDTNEPDGVTMPPLPTQLPCSDIRAHPSKCVVSAAKVDWFEPETAPTGFDVVLACDVLYTPESVDAIAALVLRLFDGNGSNGAGTVRARGSARAFPGESREVHGADGGPDEDPRVDGFSRRSGRGRVERASGAGAGERRDGAEGVRQPRGGGDGGEAQHVRRGGGGGWRMKRKRTHVFELIHRLSRKCWLTLTRTHASIGSNARSLARGGVHAACARPGCVHTDAGIPVPFFGERSVAEWM